MKIINENGNILDVTERAYNVVYSYRGYKPYTKDYSDLKKADITNF